MGTSNKCSHRVRNGAIKMHETTFREGRDNVKDRGVKWMLQRGIKSFMTFINLYQ